MRTPGELNEAQAAVLAQVGVDLDADARRALEDMARLRNLEASWQADRLIVLQVADALMEANRLHIDHVLQAIGISKSTWYRRRAELHAWMTGRGGVAAEAAGDQAEAAAKHLDSE